MDFYFHNSFRDFSVESATEEQEGRKWKVFSKNLRPSSDAPASVVFLLLLQKAPFLPSWLYLLIVKENEVR